MVSTGTEVKRRKPSAKDRRAVKRAEKQAAWETEAKEVSRWQQMIEEKEAEAEEPGVATIMLKEMLGISVSNSDEK